MISRLLYHLFTFLYPLGAWLLSPWNSKAKNWLKGRHSWRESLSNLRSRTPGPLVWMHAASLGEFEQGRPLLERIKKEYPTYRIAVTFFSPSGYEIRKDYPGADIICYLPMDSRDNAADFIRILNPDMVLWIKYEYWHHFLRCLSRSGIPVILVSGIFREDQPFFQFYGKFWRKMLHSFYHLFLQDSRSLKLAKELGVEEKSSVSGDTRFDRVVEIAQAKKKFQIVADFCQGHEVIVAGSTWEEDEAALIHFARVHPDLRFVIAPHEISAARMKELNHEFPNSVLYSELEANPGAAHSGLSVLIVDRIGMLSLLYAYATITYVGGGFGAEGIHNILEAAVHKKVVVFGPVYDKYIEAQGMIEAGGAFSVMNAVELEQLTNKLLQEESFRTAAENAAYEYVQSNSGATEKIMQFIQEKRLLTS